MLSYPEPNQGWEGNSPSRYSSELITDELLVRGHSHIPLNWKYLSGSGLGPTLSDVIFMEMLGNLGAFIYFVSPVFG
jgi:hypothetical protein